MWTNNPIQDYWFHTRKTVWESKPVFHSTQDWWFSQRLLYSTNWKISLPPQLIQKILGKHHVADVRHKAFEPTPGNIITWSDYAKQFSFEPDGQLQNKLFDNNRTLSMEGCCLDRFRKTVNVSNYYDNGGGTFTNIITQYGSFIYINLIQICKFFLRLQLISIHYWLVCLRKNKW